jgi:hypothetical protein
VPVVSTLSEGKVKGAVVETESRIYEFAVFQPVSNNAKPGWWASVSGQPLFVVKVEERTERRVSGEVFFYIAETHFPERSL